MEDILKESAQSEGAGLKRTIYFGLAQDVDVWPTLASNPTTYEAIMTHTAAFEMKTGKKFFKLEATVRKNSLESLSAGERGSLSAINRLVVMRSGVSVDVAGFIQRHKNDEMVFICNDLDGIPRVLGTSDLPAQMIEFKEGSGTDVSDEKSISFTVESVGPIAKWYGTKASPLAVPLTEAA